MKQYVYDIECLPNLFTATFVDAEDENDTRVFYVGLDKEDYTDINTFLNQEMTLIGYNNKSYDDPMLRFIMQYRGSKLNFELHHLSAKLVDDSYRMDKAILKLRYPRDLPCRWKSVDLMAILAFDKLGISLKQVAINLKWYRILDMPIHHDQRVTTNQLNLILDYNLNDVLITKKLYEVITPIRELRTELSKLYGVDLSSASDSKMANLILEKIYSTELKTDMKVIKDMRTKREKVLLGDCIASFVEFKTRELNDMLDRISSTYVYDYSGYKYSEKLSFANCNFALGVGGLHTEDAPGVFCSDDKFLIQDMDVASYYPNLIINNNFYPQHLGENFIKVLKKITAERLSAKHSGDKVKADGLKITINSIFGKLGSETFWLLDAKQMLSTTVSGQMGLLMLVEDLYLNGIQVISCNTDGVVCKIDKTKEDLYYQISKRWEEKTNLELEFTPYSKYVRRDVNSYITEKFDGKTKEKGAFLKEVDLKKAYKMPIVAQCLYAYFIKGIPVKQTLLSCDNIMEFCISQKSGGDFDMELHTTKGIEKLQKTNRFYITRKGGSLIKRNRKTNKMIGLNVGRMVRILNDYSSSDSFSSYDVDFAFYEKEVMKIIDEIEPKQLTLFDVSMIGSSNKTKMTVPLEASKKKEDRLTVEVLNKLGKNQLSKKIESIVENHEKIENISKRYVYIRSINHKNLTTEVYCLASGSLTNLSIDKNSYKDKRIDQGDLVYCSKFGKKDGLFTLIDYNITDKIEEVKESLL